MEAISVRAGSGWRQWWKGLALAASLWTAQGAGAATLTVTNFDGPSSRLLSDTTGGLLRSGTVHVGTFLDEDVIHQAGKVDRGDLVALEAAFLQFGKISTVFFNGLPGLYQDVLTQAVAADDAFAGRAIYTLITDRRVLRDAAALLIFRHDEVFLPDPSRMDPALLHEDEGQLLVGEFDRYRGSLGQIREEPMFTLTGVIPEPASVGLLLVAFVALVGGRRRG